MKLTTTTIILAILALPALAHAQDAPTPCQLALGDALEALEELDTAHEQSERTLAQAVRYAHHLARLNEVDELSLEARRDSLATARGRLDVQWSTVETAAQRDPFMSMVSSFNWIELLLAGLGLGGVGLGAFRGATGRWPMQDPKKAMESQAARLRKLKARVEAHDREMTEARSLVNGKV